MSSNQPELFEKIDRARLPRHVAVIMDGNGRWAKKNLLARVQGHREGVKTVDRIVTLSCKLNLEALTLYSFSDENWNRPEPEIRALLKILDQYLKKELQRMKDENIRFNTIGRIEEFPNPIQELIADVKNQTKENTGLVLTLALSYGGQQEILDTVRKIAFKVSEGSLRPEDIDSDLFESFLYTRDLPKPDLLIRTSGERRISNFLLYQIAYTELHYTDVFWPDFSEEDFIKALIEYQGRERRFGKTQEQILEKSSLMKSANA